MIYWKWKCDMDLIEFHFISFQKRLLMDLDISMRSSACLYTVHFYGALFREGDVWICMEVMDTSLDKFYPRVYKNDRVINEDILGKVCWSPRTYRNGSSMTSYLSTYRFIHSISDCRSSCECTLLSTRKLESHPSVCSIEFLQFSL